MTFAVDCVDDAVAVRNKVGDLGSLRARVELVAVFQRSHDTWSSNSRSDRPG